MNRADVAPQPEFFAGTTACVGLACLMLVSGIVLALVLYRRGQRNRELHGGATSASVVAGATSSRPEPSQDFDFSGPGAGEPADGGASGGDGGPSGTPSSPAPDSGSAGHSSPDVGAFGGDSSGGSAG